MSSPHEQDPDSDNESLLDELYIIYGGSGIKVHKRSDLFKPKDKPPKSGEFSRSLLRELIEASKKRH
ncbi:hypothetical protein A2872_03590 [Candidatus Gottesmanbacteria bacterium RIFCSPHIGHO2_01_FULL_42_12]|uniref:Uncharacterized protein n=1 Tax=Candidatus Gottesmanbacteria bacterium RIFCSPHIGHO2_01_FULL_42_12 TaxID=1798377 RepID=A0A1F5Z4M1_9BACT|nr:MAG: hypothetical protein A2872_03590 [Candidatus Gottesmanbacteria bacterium RIFCSPHIGHO2_01_FULL_42_12]